MLKGPLDRPGLELREQVAQGLVVLPGVYDALSAVAACDAGAKALYLSGGAATNALLGVPDIGLVTQTEMADLAARVCQVAQVPVLADADTGFGEPWNVARTVIAFERAGLAGLHLEDQRNPKRCGHLEGKELVPEVEMVGKLRAALDARRDDTFLVVARTDARGVEGVDAALERAHAYAEAGADAVFPEGLESLEEFERFALALPVPVLANMTEFGKTPLITVDEFRRSGVRLLIFPVTALRMALRALRRTYAELLAKGTQRDLLADMTTRQELYDLIGYGEYTSRDASWSERADGPTG